MRYSSKMLKGFSLSLLLVILLGNAEAQRKKPVVIWQPSHQTDTGKDFSEAEVCNAIVEAAIATEPRLKERKVWSLAKKKYHHHDRGSNTVIEHT